MKYVKKIILVLLTLTSQAIYPKESSLFIKEKIISQIFTGQKPSTAEINEQIDQLTEKKNELPSHDVRHQGIQDAITELKKYIAEQSTASKKTPVITQPTKPNNPPAIAPIPTPTIIQTQPVTPKNQPVKQINPPAIPQPITTPPVIQTQPVMPKSQPVKQINPPVVAQPIITPTVIQQPAQTAIPAETDPETKITVSTQPKITKAAIKAGDKLIKESYITPEMQWYMVAPTFTLDIKTGSVHGIKTVHDKINEIYSMLANPISAAQKESIKNCLHAMLEATDIAIFVANMQAAYENQRFIFYQNADSALLADLNNQKQIITTTLNLLMNNKPSDEIPAQASYFSWIWGSSATNTPPPSDPVVQPVSISHNATQVTIPQSAMPTIIKTNDYKEMTDTVQAANFLFKACFIAQQHHLKDAHRIEELKINLQGPITESNYIFTNFPAIYDNNSKSYPICEIAQNLVYDANLRYHHSSTLTKKHHLAHMLLLHIRQAIQTAIYIANKNSSYNVGYLLPASVISYLDGIVSQLVIYDTYLDTLCKDPLYGATDDDIYNSKFWSGVTKWAVAGVALITIGYVGVQSGAVTAAAQGASDAWDWLKNTKSEPVAPITTTTVYNNITQSSAWEILNNLGGAGVVLGVLNMANTDPIFKPIAQKISDDLKRCDSVGKFGVSVYKIGTSTSVNQAAGRLFYAFFFTAPGGLKTIYDYMYPKAVQQKTQKLNAERLGQGLIDLIKTASFQGADISNLLVEISANIIQKKAATPVMIVESLESIQAKVKNNPAVFQPVQKAIDYIMQNFIGQEQLEESLVYQ